MARADVTGPCDGASTSWSAYHALEVARDDIDALGEHGHGCILRAEVLREGRTGIGIPGGQDMRNVIDGDALGFDRIDLRTRIQSVVGCEHLHSVRSHGSRARMHSHTFQHANGGLIRRAAHEQRRVCIGNP